MCGRFTLSRQNRRELAQLLGVDEDDLRDYRPRYNVSPTDPHFSLLQNTSDGLRGLRVGAWSIRGPATTAVPANASTPKRRRLRNAEPFEKRSCSVAAQSQRMASTSGVVQRLNVSLSGYILGTVDCSYLPACTSRGRQGPESGSGHSPSSRPRPTG